MTKNGRLIRLGLVFALALLGTCCASGCQQKRPVKIGYVGGLTGHLADLGVAGRDGALLAVAEVNAGGGINGRPLELVIKDDRNEPAIATQVDRELVREKVVAIVGHMTSAMSVAGLTVTDGAGVVLLSPTTSSNELAGKDDNFLRIYPASQLMASRLAGQMSRQGLQRVTVVYDLANRAHTEGWFNSLRAALTDRGVGVRGITFNSREKSSFQALAEQALDGRPDGVMLLAGAVNTAMICQQLRKLGSTVPFFASEWSGGEELLKQGSGAVEGLCFYQFFEATSQSEPYQQFKKNFSQRFGVAPSFGAAYAFESVKLLAAALQQTKGEQSGLKEAILRSSTFPGLQSAIQIDRFGDAIRQPFLITVRDGRFIRLE